MTDHPRFHAITGEPDSCHRNYHGAPVVDLALRLADRWQGRRRPEQHSRGAVDWPATHGVAALFIATVLLLAGVIETVAQQSLRVRGTIEETADGIYVVRTRSDQVVRLRLADNASVAASISASLSDIKPGLYIGVAAMPQADGSMRALEAHIFHESMRGTGDGHRSWDLLPRSTMTNAVVEAIVGAVDGHTVTLRYKDGRQTITIPLGTTIVTYLPGSVSELKPGASIFVPGTASQPDGTLMAQRVMVGRDVAPPQ